MTIKLKDEVVMKAAVIKRTNHSDFAKNFKGVVVNIVGKTADDSVCSYCKPFSHSQCM